MRVLILAAALVLPAAAAHAETPDDARSATAACLSAVIDNAPVEDVTEGDISIHRGTDPVSCTVSVADGAPVVIHDAVMTAIKRRTELFSPAKTRWDAEAFATREAFCNLSLRRHLNAVVSTARPGQSPVLVMTVFEAAKRDPRCDRDEGVQAVAASATPTAPPAAAPAAPPPTELTNVAPKKKKKGWHVPLPHLPGHKDG